MRYYMLISGGYILGIGTGNGGTEITESEYHNIMTAIQNRPKETDTMAYRLKEDLTWESYEVEPLPEPEDIDDSEALEILLGGA